MLDKKEIRVVYSSSKWVIKQQRQVTTSTMHLAQELLMNVQCISGSGSFAKKTRALKIRSISQFSHSVVSDSLQPHGLQYTRLPCPSPTPGACSNSCPSSQWCHLILCRPLLLLPSILPSIRVFSKWVSSSHQVAKALELQHSSWLLDVDKDQLRAIIKADPLSSPSLSVPSRSQHQSLFQWVNSSHEVAKALEFQL